MLPLCCGCDGADSALPANPIQDTPTSHALSSTSRERKSLEMADKTTPPGTPPYSADDPASNSGETSAAP